MSETSSIKLIDINTSFPFKTVIAGEKYNIGLLSAENFNFTDEELEIITHITGNFDYRILYKIINDATAKELQDVIKKVSQGLEDENFITYNSGSSHSKRNLIKSLSQSFKNKDALYSKTLEFFSSLSTDEEKVQKLQRLLKEVIDYVFLDEKVNRTISYVDKPFFLPKKAEWYLNEISKGNIFFTIKKPDGKLVSKTGVILNCRNPAEHGFSKRSHVGASLATQFNEHGSAAIITVMATDPEYQGKDLQGTLIKNIASYIISINKTIMAAMVAVRNVSSLSVLVNQGAMHVIGINAHEKTDAPYYQLTGNPHYTIAQESDDKKGNKRPRENLRDTHITDDQIARSIDNRQPSIWIPLSIDGGFSKELWNSPTFMNIAAAFNGGYRCNAIERLRRPELGNGDKAYMSFIYD